MIVGVSARIGCKISIYIGIQTHRKLDNDTLNMYYGQVSERVFYLGCPPKVIRSEIHEQDYRN